MNSPFQDWKEMFDLIICSANKPDFYHSKRPFRKWNIATGSPSTEPVRELEKGVPYVHGSVDALVRATGTVTNLALEYRSTNHYYYYCCYCYYYYCYQYYCW